jgi:hypothetical protein
MSESLPVVRRLAGPAARPGEVAPDAPRGGYASTRGYDAGPAPIPSRQLDELVDLVVERIEARVVDELERRGRRTVGW